MVFEKILYDDNIKPKTKLTDYPHLNEYYPVEEHSVYSMIKSDRE